MYLLGTAFLIKMQHPEEQVQTTKKTGRCSVIEQECYVAKTTVGKR